MNGVISRGSKGMSIGGCRIFWTMVYLREGEFAKKNIRERLNRGMANDGMMTLVPNMRVLHLHIRIMIVVLSLFLWSKRS